MIVGAYDSLLVGDCLSQAQRGTHVTDPILEFISGPHHARVWSVVLRTCFILLVQHKLASKDGVTVGM